MGPPAQGVSGRPKVTRISHRLRKHARRPMIRVVVATLTKRLKALARMGLDPVRALPPRARGWWAATLLASIALAPACLRLAQPDLPLMALLLAPVLNRVLVIATAPRRQ